MAEVAFSGGEFGSVIAGKSLLQVAHFGLIGCGAV
jgi:hypothetical protein